MNVRRWLPQTLTGQLLALLLAGLAASHLAGVLVLSAQRELGDLHPLARRKALEQYAALYRGVQDLPPAAARQVLAAASGDQAAYALAPAPLALPAAHADDSVAQDLMPQLGAGARALQACTGDICTAQAGRETMRPLVVQARRPDGQWLTGTLWVQVRTRWWWPTSFWLQASLVPIFLAVALAVRGLMRPARALVAAAGRVSRGETVEPLPVQGPREMREITQAFNRMQARLGRFVADRTRMLAAISHDFRTPITSLRLRAELIDDDSVREPMLQTLAEMRSMVEATLQFAREDARPEPTVDADLHALAAEVIAAQRALGRDVDWAEPPGICWPYRCRPVALKRALTNLVDNAVRYGRCARLRLSPLDGGARIAIEVQDDGPGIAPAARETVFAPFQRLAAEGQPDGSGLGLAIARSCARAHGGDVELHDGPSGRGLLAQLVLPA